MKLARSFAEELSNARPTVGWLAAREGDDTGIICVEIDDGQWATGDNIPTLFQLLADLGDNVSEQRRAEMSARYPQRR